MYSRRFMSTFYLNSFGGMVFKKITCENFVFYICKNDYSTSYATTNKKITYESATRNCYNNLQWRYNVESIKVKNLKWRQVVISRDVQVPRPLIAKKAQNSKFGCFFRFYIKKVSHGGRLNVTSRC